MDVKEFFSEPWVWEDEEEDPGKMKTEQRRTQWNRR